MRADYQADAPRHPPDPAVPEREWLGVDIQEKARFQCATVRDMLGPLPFRSIRIDPAWLTWQDGAAVHIAQAIYDERRFQDMTILADALKEAGCTDPEILGHWRGPGEHVRGCWVVDLVLGKT